MAILAVGALAYGGATFAGFAAYAGTAASVAMTAYSMYTASKQHIKSSGPRLDNLKVSESSYGSPLGRVYGTKRVACNVIWASDIEEEETTETSGGKGSGPKQSYTSYSYYGNFAVALCDTRHTGEITGVTRIWANGKLIYDITQNSVEADWQSGKVDFVLYRGSDSQMPDSLMESYLGVGNVPAYRGTAYIVFRRVPLAEFGNTIPNLNVEVTTEPVVSTVVDYYSRGGSTTGVLVSVVDAEAGTVGVTAATRTWPGIDVYKNEANVKEASGLVYTKSFPYKWRTQPKILGGVGDFAFAGKHNCFTTISYQKDATSVYNLAIYQYNTVDGSLLSTTEASALGPKVVEYNTTALVDVVIPTPNMPDGDDLCCTGYVRGCYWVASRNALYKVTESGELTVYNQIVPVQSSRYGAILEVGGVCFLAAKTGQSTSKITHLFNPDTAEFTAIDYTLDGQAVNAMRINAWDSEFIYTKRTDSVMVKHSPPRVDGDNLTGVFYYQCPVGVDSFTLGSCGEMVNNKFFYGRNRWYRISSSFDQQGVKLSDVVKSELSLAGISLADVDVTDIPDSVKVMGCELANNPRESLEMLCSAYLFDIICTGQKVKAVMRGKPSSLNIQEADVVND